MDAEEFLPLTPLSFEILLALADGGRHGYGIIKEMEARTGKPLKSSTGTLYVAIQRLEQEELIAEVEPEDADDSRRRCYGLTELGAEVVVAEAERLATLLGIARVKRLLSSKSLLEVAGSRKS